MLVAGGKPLSQVWFRHADIANGGKLELQIGNTPNEKLVRTRPVFRPRKWRLSYLILYRLIELNLAQNIC